MPHVTRQREQLIYIANQTLNLLMKILTCPFTRYHRVNQTHVQYQDIELQNRCIKTVYCAYCILKKLAARRKLSAPSFFFTYVFGGPLKQSQRSEYVYQIIRASVSLLQKLYCNYKTVSSYKILTLHAFILNRLNWTMRGILQEITIIY